jgi:cytochrome c-type biogenesis protein CcmH/NrfF
MIEYRFAFEQAIDDLAEEQTKKLRELAQDCQDAFGEKSKSQVSHLERLGLSSRRYGDLIAYAMRQTGKKTTGWLTPCGRLLFGQKLVHFLEELKEKIDARWEKEEFGQKLGAEKKNELRLKVAQICLRNLNSAYLYELRKEG